MSTLAKKVYETVHKSKLSVAQLADLIGCSESMLYRMANPMDEATGLKIEQAIPLMEATKNYSILHHLAHRLGFVCVKIPGGRMMDPGQIAAHQRTLAEYISALIDYRDGERGRDETLDVVKRALTEVAAAKKMVEKCGSQAELFEE